MSEDKIIIGALPRKELESALKGMLPYCVGLFSLYHCDGNPVTKLIGSGTLIQVDDVYGILTAQHITDLAKRSSLYNKAERIGVSIRNDLHCFSIERQNLTVREIGVPESPSAGPDISVIILPGTDVGTIKATKSFWNIYRYRDKILNEPLKIDEGVWAIFGCPDIYSRGIMNLKNLLRSEAFLGIAGYSGIEEEWKKDTFDYYKLSVLYGSDLSNPPEDFGGVSGGGLWRVVVERRHNNQLIFRDPILYGLAFYQTDVIDNRRSIVCHGRNSIYNRVYHNLKSMA